MELYYLCVNLITDRKVLEDKHIDCPCGMCPQDVFIIMTQVIMTDDWREIHHVSLLNCDTQPAFSRERDAPTHIIVSRFKELWWDV